MNKRPKTSDTIVATTTPSGESAVAVIRLSGPNAIAISAEHFRGKRNLTDLDGYQAAYGNFVDGEQIIDEVVVLIFKNPNSFTGEDSVEITTHGSMFITESIINALIASGARPARPGEFTQRAYLNGRIDLAQAEAVADLIASNSSSSLQLALNQLRGGVSNEIKELRDKLLELASLLELELDFSEEDVEFANRDKLTELLSYSIKKTESLTATFRSGNALKNGIPVAIIGKPNAGKSTLLNILLKEERAIVSDTPGTTRDTIEEEITIDGIRFRFIDTAGIRSSEDFIEQQGVERAYQSASKASIIIYLFDLSTNDQDSIDEDLNALKEYTASNNPTVITVANKTDLNNDVKQFSSDVIKISAKNNENTDKIISILGDHANKNKQEAGDVTITNIRHKAALDNAGKYLIKALDGLKTELTIDLIASDLRSALFHLGEITGEVSTEEILGSIFSRFCIGK